jgi:hypothetical protein
MLRVAVIIAGLLLQQGTSTTGVMTGEILSLNGTPAVGVRVAVMATSNGNTSQTNFSSMESIGETDSSGRYRLERISPGRYIVVAGLLDLPTYYPGVKDPGDARVVTIEAGTIATGINFKLAQTAGVRVSGRVTGYLLACPMGLFMPLCCRQRASGNQLSFGSSCSERWFIRIPEDPSGTLQSALFFPVLRQS